jgi:hypothetical protein
MKMTWMTNPSRQRSGDARGWAVQLVAATLLGMAWFLPSANAKSDEVITASSGVTYVSGGAGTEAIDRLRSMEKEFNLKLVFALKSGAYLADVKVTVVDAANNVVLDTKAEGPWLLARLPAGTYQVNASYGTLVERRAVTVGAATLSTVELRWPAG